MHLVDVAKRPIQRRKHKIFLRHIVHALRGQRTFGEHPAVRRLCMLVSVWEEVSKYSLVRKKLAIVTSSPFCD